VATLYSRKANNDATAAREFADNPEISDEIIGFHAQQAVEKWLKAVMANLGLPQQRTLCRAAAIRGLTGRRAPRPPCDGRLTWDSRSLSSRSSLH